MEVSLDSIFPGMQALITGIHVEHHLRQRLQDFGLIPGTLVRCRYWNPGRTVVALELRGSILALRSKDARRIDVRMVT